MSSDARPSALVHATDELLEEYSFGRIREPQLSWLEEHLLICQTCQSELEDIDEYKVFIKAGLVSFERERQAVEAPGDSPKGRDPGVRWWSSLQGALSLLFALPKLPFSGNLLAAGFMLVLAGATVAWRMQSSVVLAPVATLKLIALRGGDGGFARAPSGRPLDLVLDRSDLMADLSYRAEVVDSSGRQMWSGSVRIADQNLSIRVDRKLRAGSYWVRLYTSAGQLLREFGLSVG